MDVAMERSVIQISDRKASANVLGTFLPGDQRGSDLRSRGKTVDVLKGSCTAAEGIEVMSMSPWLIRYIQTNSLFLLT